MGLIPIYTFEEGDQLPDKGTYYVIGSNGIFLHKDTGIISALVKVDKIATLAEVDTNIAMKLPKIPPEILYQALLFFRRVWYQYKGEAEVNILYSKKEKKYKLVARKQRVSGGGVNYSPRGGASVHDGERFHSGEDPEEVRFYSQQQKEGWSRVGTIHSHCNFGAFHSGTDTADEAVFDGVHITCGHVDRKHFSMVASLVCNDNRFQVDPENVVYGIEPKSDNGGSKYAWMGNWSQPANYYDFTFTDEEIDKLNRELVPYINREWLPLVSDNFWRGGGGSNSGTDYSWRGTQSGPRTITIPVGDPLPKGGVVPTPAPASGCNSPAPTTECLSDGQQSLFPDAASMPEGAFAGQDAPTPTPKESTEAANLPVAVIVSVKDDMLGSVNAIAEKLTAIGMTKTEALPDIGVISGELPPNKIAEAQAVEGVQAIETSKDSTTQEPTTQSVVQLTQNLETETQVARSALEEKFAEEDREKLMWRVRGAAHALRSSAVDIPPDRKQALLATLRQYFGKEEITDSDLETAANLDPSKEKSCPSK